MSFYKDFVWGAATAAYQIEGAWNEDGRKPSIWDIHSHEPGKIFDNHNGDVACDHYHRYKEDVALMKELGLKGYRFSVSWSRIIPDGTGEINEKGVKFYSDLIDELLANGIEPYLTLFHWDYPHELYKRGGWMNPDSVKWFSDYAAKVVELFSDRVKYFITFNEPQCFIGQGFVQGCHAPGLKIGYKDAFLMAHNVMKAHGAAVIEMRKAAKQAIKIGYAPTGPVCYPSTETKEDIDAARKEMFRCPELGCEVFWNISWWCDPVYLGKYPEDGLEIYKDFLPEITEEDMELIHQPIDFMGQNIYNGAEYKCGADGKPEFVKRKVGYPVNSIGWPVTPECLRWGPVFLCERYGLPLYITENGMSGHDNVGLDGKVHDGDRITFVHTYLNELEKATDDGADVRGYFLWSLMDNFEWGRGYSSRFGIIHVDYETQKRTLKDSAYWYKTWIEKHS